MDGMANQFGWCRQENIEDWNFASIENTAGFYAIEPASRIINAMAAQYSIIFWTVQGAYVVEYKALPYIYTYSFLGQHTAPLSGMAPVAYSGTVMWPAADGFWRFDGTQVQPVVCAVLDWFQQTYDEKATRAYMARLVQRRQLRAVVVLPGQGLDRERHADHLQFPGEVVVDRQAQAHLRRARLDRRLPAHGLDRHHLPARARATSTPTSPSCRGSAPAFINIEGGVRDGDDEAARGRYRRRPRRGVLSALRHQGPLQERAGAHQGAEAAQRRAGSTTQGKIDYRISGRDFAVKMALAPAA